MDAMHFVCEVGVFFRKINGKYIFRHWKSFQLQPRLTLQFQCCLRGGSVPRGLCLCGFILLNIPTLWSTNTIQLYPRSPGATHITNEALMSGLSWVSYCTGWPKGLDERERHIGVWFHYEGHSGLLVDQMMQCGLRLMKWMNSSELM